MSKKSDAAYRRPANVARRRKKEAIRDCAEEMSKARKNGRPPEYRESFCELAHGLALLGHDDAEIAGVIGISEDILNVWKSEHQRFYDSIIDGRDRADAKVAASMYRRACGYEHTATKVLQNNGVPVIVEYTERFPPETQAASLWLRNRQPRKWRDKVDVEHSGSIGVHEAALEELDKP